MFLSKVISKQPFFWSVNNVVPIKQEIFAVSCTREKVRFMFLRSETFKEKWSERGISSKSTQCSQVIEMQCLLMQDLKMGKIVQLYI